MNLLFLILFLHNLVLGSKPIHKLARFEGAIPFDEFAVLNKVIDDWKW